MNYGGRWKLLHYTAKKFFAPLIISADYDAGTNLAAVYLTSDVNQALSGNAPLPERMRVWCLGDLGCQMPCMPERPHLVLPKSDTFASASVPQLLRSCVALLSLSAPLIALQLLARGRWAVDGMCLTC